MVLSFFMAIPLRRKLTHTYTMVYEGYYGGTNACNIVLWQARQYDL